MLTPQAKRRRLNDATSTLKKPFKSPFRTPLRPTTGSDPPCSGSPNTSTAAGSLPYSTPLIASGTVHNEVSQPESVLATPAPSTQPNPPKSLTLRSSFSTPTRPVQKKTPSKTSLTRELMQLRSEIQILTQAHALATSTKDDNLQVLIDRWRTASRAAAEELFGITRDRVNRMGGVGAWKEREKEAKERTMKWDLEEREAERERMEEAKENGEIGDEVYDKYAEMADERDEEEGEDSVPNAADDDVSGLHNATRTPY